MSWGQRKGLQTMVSILDAYRYTSNKPTHKLIKHVPVHHRDQTPTHPHSTPLSELKRALNRKQDKTVISLGSRDSNCHRSGFCFLLEAGFHAAQPSFKLAM